MLFEKENLKKILAELGQYDATLVAVSKKKTIEAIRGVYDSGHLNFGENYVQELTEKAAVLPKDIKWHFIGHLQSNKVKLIAPFVSLIHSVDSFELLKEINRQAKKNKRIIDCLMQVHIAQEETKFGLSFSETESILTHPELNQLQNICIRGLMGMATLTGDRATIRKEFHSLSEYYHQLQGRVFKPQKLNGKRPPLMSDADDEIKISKQTPSQPINSNLKPEILSMGMSSDYKIALLEGSNMVRIGSLIFGER